VGGRKGRRGSWKAAQKFCNQSILPKSGTSYLQPTVLHVKASNPTTPPTSNQSQLQPTVIHVKSTKTIHQNSNPSSHLWVSETRSTYLTKVSEKRSSTHVTTSCECLSDVEGKIGIGNFVDLADALPSLFPDPLGGAPWLEIYNMENCMHSICIKRNV
jgi:hypothetical protein